MSEIKFIRTDQRIALALSGGGYRAAAFHAGVLKWLAESGWLEQVTAISTVSGGSLFAGLVFAQNGNTWPSSSEFLENGYPLIRRVLAHNSLEFEALKQMINPLNWRFMFSRANLVAISLEKKWKIDARLKDLPSNPVWSINGTTAENGRRFRFKGITLGDYETGYANGEDLRLATALAVSAAFPGGIGPLRLDAVDYEWKRRESWDSKERPEPTEPPFPFLHLYDGGLYDNLGMEPLFDPGRGVIKSNAGADFLVVSDAGAPFQRQSIPGPFHPKRLIRTMNIVMDQARALRVRSFVHFLRGNPKSGRYFMIGANVRDQVKNGLLQSGNPVLEDCKLSDDEIAFARNFSTRLKALGEETFDLIARHGYETAKWNNELTSFGESTPASSIPI